MKRIFTFLTLFLFLAVATFAQEIEKEQLDRNGYPTFVKFDAKQKAASKSETKAVLSSILKMTKSDEFKTLRSEDDRLGFTHERFQQYYKGIKVENGVYIVHSRNGVIESLSGEYKLIKEISVAPSISSENATKKAKAFVNADQYMGTDNKAFHTAPELVVVAHDYGKHPKDVHEMVLAYKIDVYATQPVSRAFIYIDANTGEVVHINTLIKNVAATGTADTRYSGTKSISTDSYNSSYRLRDYTRGNGIITYDCNTSTSYTSAVDFTDANNSWTAAEYDNSAKDNGALDAHWAGMMTYDYFQNVHGRNSFDGNGALMKTYVHFDRNYDNAYWNGSVFTFGDGSSFDILTSLDVFGHEFGHAVCSYTADLNYQNEEGALNEAFSDIWGCAIEYKYAPEKDTWLMGEDLGSALRSISDPKSKGLPDTYQGTNWASLSSSPSQYNDYGGVHTNNGPFCYWFYLISAGGSGTNDNNDAYNVTAIGIDKAEQITFRVESQYMTSTSNYNNARTFVIQAAIDLYGAGSQEEISVTNAMYAVGVGDAYGGVTPPVSATYCESKSNDFSYEWIASVEIGAFTKTSAGTAYSDYTSSVIDVNAGDTYNVTLTPGFASSTYDEYWKIWIDYNNDTVFDANELAYDAGALSKVAVNGTITIPTGISGIRRMRVSMNYNAEQDACQTLSYGEVEDYHVNIGTSGGDTQAPTAPTGLSSSSVTETTFTLSWNAASDNVAVTGYDVYSNGSLLGSVTSTSANITGLTASTTYAMTVKAKDAAGNVSVASTALNVTTSATADTQAPTAPTGLSSSSITETSFTLSWNAASDNVAVTGYDVYQNGSSIGSVTGTSANITSLTASTTYAMTVKAKDAAGNISTISSTLNVTTADQTGGGCTGGISSFPYSEGFESGIGTWTQDASDDFDWTVDANGTPSSSTGPSAADEGTYYIFVESSSPNYPSKVGIINSPCFDLTTESNANYNFAYHMYGSSMGTIELQASTDGTSWTTLWTKSGDQGNSWYNATVSLSAYYGTSVQLRYVATTSTSYRSDFAIDDISVTTGGTTPTANNLTLTITFDNYPEETSWTLKNSGGSTVASGGTYASQADGSTLVIPINDLADGCYDFTISDVYGDGMCCSYGNGSYTLEVTGGATIKTGGSFGSSEVTNFCLPNTTYGFAPTTTSFGDVSTKPIINIYPNPASTYINVQVTNATAHGVISIYSATGSLVKVVEIEESEREINISELPSGLYLISIDTKKEAITRQFIKK
ncbi:MAG: M4 family metallopeptidase [Bacteroidales bacterium]|nr:M4 family metallopeptidase [Bacteroidales bacterium]